LKNVHIIMVVPTPTIESIGWRNQSSFTFISQHLLWSMSMSYRQSDNISISKAVYRFRFVHDAEAKIFSDISAIFHMGFLSFMFLVIEKEFGVWSIPSSMSLFATIAAMGKAPVAPGEL
jgi:hypothetical protein